MVFRYKDENSTLKSHIDTLRIVIGFQCLLIVGLWFGWHGVQKDIRLHVPPDLRSGAVLKPGEIPPPNVYAFANYIFQQLNHWETDGETDYGKQVFRMSAYLTPDFRQFLTNDLELRGKRGELAGRVRGVQLIPGHGYEERRVDVLDRNTWLVWLDFRIEETVRGMDVKSLDIRYPIRVVRYDVNPEVNPWGLALDGFGGDGPQRLKGDDKAKTGG